MKVQRLGIVRGPVRERVLVAFLILAGVALGHARTPVAADAPALTFYVATDGNNNWSDTLPAPNSNRTDGPFATLIRARDTIRKLKGEQGLKDSVTVMVREGKYFLDRTVVFGPEDSGTEDYPITYEAYSGETPILSAPQAPDGGQRAPLQANKESPIPLCLTETDLAGAEDPINQDFSNAAMVHHFPRKNSTRG